jgi:hypothetical protein
LRVVRSEAPRPSRRSTQLQRRALRRRRSSTP